VAIIVTQPTEKDAIVEIPTNQLSKMIRSEFSTTKEDLLVRARDRGAGQNILEVLESFPAGTNFESLADVVSAYKESDQAPQTGILERKT
jgi:hypothetical protein